ncbi:O-antigen polymerase [Rossellomorea vietnamensis]|uniref:O-antigen polymerase n=1 Tax=Rossellomorea vietnamensis TaxID=218284 RepID=UPI00077C61D0|nr:O-antigen polymerase [Rossellomorea vietnamensis]
MLTTLIILILILTILGLTFVEKRKYKTFLSPFILFSVPYLVLILYQVIVTNIYNWEPVSVVFLIYIFLYLVTFYFVGTFSIHFFEAFYKKYSIKTQIKYDNSLQSTRTKNKVIEIISIVVAAYLIIFFIFQMRGLPNTGMVVQEEFQSTYSSGFNFYLRLICMIGSVYFWGLANKNNKRFLLLGFLCFIPNLLTFVKGITFILILGGILANLFIYNKKVKPKNILSIVGSAIAVFFLIYLIEIGVWDTEKLFVKETYENIFGKLNVYLISGVQSFNVNVIGNHSFQGIPNPVYAPVLNIFSKLGIVDRVDSINNIWVNVGYIPNYGNVNVNTNTFIGTLVLYCGPIIGLFINSLVSIIIYYLFYRTIKTRKTIQIVRYALIVTGLALSWFEYFYMHTFWFYLIGFFLIFELINKLRITRSKSSDYLKKYSSEQSLRNFQ